MDTSMDADAQLARELQKQFDEEEAVAAAQEKEDTRLAHRLAKDAHQLSDSESEEELNHRFTKTENDDQGRPEAAGQSQKQTKHSSKTLDSNLSKNEVLSKELLMHAGSSKGHVNESKCKSKDGLEGVRSTGSEIKSNTNLDKSESFSADKRKDKHSGNERTKLEGTHSPKIKDTTLNSSNSSASNSNKNRRITDQISEKESSTNKIFSKHHTPSKNSATLQASPNICKTNSLSEGNLLLDTPKTPNRLLIKSKSACTEKSSEPYSKQNSDKSLAHSSATSRDKSSDRSCSISENVSLNVSDKSSSLATIRPLCKYGQDCYRKNPDHLREFRHNKEEGSKRSSTKAREGEQPGTTDGANAGTKRARTEDAEKSEKRQSKQNEGVITSTEDKNSKEKDYRKRKSEDCTPSKAPPPAAVNDAAASADTAAAAKRRKTGESSRASSSGLQGFAARLAASDPYRVFLTKSFSLPATHKDRLGLVLPDLFHSSLGTIVETAQLSFVVDAGFLQETYEAVGLADKPLLLLYGEMGGEGDPLPQATMVKVKMPYLYGCHHSKLMLLLYEEGLRVVVHTANLTPDDWFEKTQGVWVSPLFPKLDGSAKGPSTPPSGDSPSQFRQDLLLYLQTYKLGALTRWTTIIRRHDFAACNAVFIGHTPGYHVGPQLPSYGHMKLRRALARHCPANPWRSALQGDCTTVVQCSSIGSLGADSRSWLCSELATSLSGGVDGCSPQKMCVVYPSEEDIRNSSQGWMGGSCLPYSSKTHAKQQWLQRHLHLWRSNSRGRSLGMPHIKSFTRLSSDHTTAQYLLLTSSNLSKAAWGQLQKQNSQLFIRSYEAGVLLLPKFVTGGDSFPLASSTSSPALPLAYDLPLTPYPEGARPWMKDTKKKSKDVNGETYLC